MFFRSHPRKPKPFYNLNQNRNSPINEHITLKQQTDIIILRDKELAAWFETFFKILKILIKSK